MKVFIELHGPEAVIFKGIVEAVNPLEGLKAKLREIELLKGGLMKSASAYCRPADVVAKPGSLYHDVKEAAR
jgi:hypothetical protein